MVVAMMAAVGCVENGLLGMDRTSKRESYDLSKYCKKNGMQNISFISESSRESHGLDRQKSHSFGAMGPSLQASVGGGGIGQSQGMEGTSAIVFAKPSIPSLRSRQQRAAGPNVMRNKTTLVDSVTNEPVVRRDSSGVRTRRSAGGIISPSSNDCATPLSKLVAFGSKGTGHLIRVNGTVTTAATTTTTPNSSNNNNNNTNHNCHSKKERVVPKHTDPCTKMGVLCTDPSCDKDPCGCQDVSTGSPRPASLPSSSPPTSPSSHQASRKRSLDLTSQTEEVDSAVRRRVHRTPSAGSINGTNVHAVSLITTRASKLIVAEEDIASVVLGKNGKAARHDMVTTRLNGIKLSRVPSSSSSSGHQKSDEKLRLCMDPHGQHDLEGGHPVNGHCDDYPRTTQHNHILPESASSRHASFSQVKENSSISISSSLPTSSSLSVSLSPSSSLSSVLTPSSSCPSVPHNSSDENVVDNGNSSSDNSYSNVKDCSTTTNSITTFQGSKSNSNILTSNGDSEEDVTLSLPLSPHEIRLTTSSNSSSSLTHSCSKQQQNHQFSNAQGLLPITEGSSGRQSSSASSFSSLNKAALVATTTTTTTISRCSSVTSISDTVPNLRQRSYSGSNSSKTAILSIEAAPISSTSKILTSLPKQHGLAKVKSSSSTSSISSTSSSSSSSSSALPAEQVECKWRGCSLRLDPSDLLDHVRKHAEAQISKKKYACLWTDCKVYDQPSLSGSWLERHIVSHSGHRPFKCIVPKCGQRFHSQMALERHVNGHFTTTSPGTSKTGRSRDEINQQRMLQKRRKQLKRRSVQSVKTSDFFDEETMSMVKQQVETLTQLSQVGLSDSNPLSVTFSGTVVGRRTNVSGSKQSLMEFKPADILEDHWMSQSSSSEQDLTQLCIPLAFLPHDTVTHLHSSLYRRHRFRKHRRK